MARASTRRCRRSSTRTTSSRRCVEAGHLDRSAPRRAGGPVFGLHRAPAHRGGHSLYASLVYIGADGAIGSVHRKLMPTYEERLAWYPGDGHGLRTHRLGAFTVGGLNCWENWMPLPRAALLCAGRGPARGDLAGRAAQHARPHALPRQGRPLVRDLGEGFDAREDIGLGVPQRERIVGACPDAGERWLVLGRPRWRVAAQLVGEELRFWWRPSITGAFGKSARTSISPVITPVRMCSGSPLIANGKRPRRSRIELCRATDVPRGPLGDWLPLTWR